MTKLQIIPRASVQLKMAKGLKGDKGATGNPAAPNSITNVELADMASGTLKGRASFGRGNPQDLPVDSVKAMLAYSLDDMPDSGALARKDTVSSGDINVAGVENFNLANMAQGRLKGRAAASGTGAPGDLTAAQVKTILALTSADISDFTAAAQAATPSGTLIKSGYAEYTVNADLTTAIPVDDTIPQITEGTQVLSLSHTPAAAANTLEVEVQVQGTTSAVGALVVALFANGNANAVRTAYASIATAQYNENIILRFRYSPGTTATQTFTVRVGSASGTTVRLNGGTTGRFLGGTIAATITAKEFKA